MDEIKHEFRGDRSLQCRTCLSIGRSLKPLRELTSIYVKITSEFMYPAQDFLESIQICWQCRSLLRKVAQFREQVKKADELLLTNQSFIYGPLTSLVSVTINEKYQGIYICEANIQQAEESITKIENNEETLHEKYLAKDSTDVSEDDLENTAPLDKLSNKDSQNCLQDVKTKQNKSRSRWAVKCAQQNKKPKFKISTNYGETFQKIQISYEESALCIKKERDTEYYKSKKYKCDSCVIGFLNRDILVKHDQKFHMKNGMFCDICDSVFLSKSKLLAHLRKHYMVYKCILCQYVCRKGMRMWHFQKEHKKTFQCLKCKIHVRSRHDFFNHFKEWHERFICDYCGIGFKMRYCIKDHIRKQHSPFTCKPCNRTFARYNGLWLHNKLVHRPASPAYCAECDAHYDNTLKLQWHLCSSVRHNTRNKLRIPCPSCNKIFSKKIYMTDHYNLVHLKVFKYRCEACNKNFIRNADLVKHKRKIHEGILPPKNKICYICGRGFTTNKILHNHIRTHTGERPFACVCGARFTQSSAAHAHMRKHTHTAVK